MIVESRYKLLGAFLLFALVPFYVIPTSVETVPALLGVPLRQSSDWDLHGPYVDKVIFKLITGPDEQVQALLDDEIDHLADNVEAEYLSILEAEPDIEVTLTEYLGFGFMAINCQRYPYNFPGFRRALAFALDKHALAQDMWGDLGSALDTPIPASCGAWHNSQIIPDFRDSNVIAAQTELAQAGFFDLDGDGYVEAPNGDQINFRPMYSIETPQWGAALTSQLAYWDAAGIRVSLMPVAFGTLLDTVYTIPRNYDAACYAFGVSPTPLALQNFISSEILNSEGNMLNWGNRIFDNWVEVMMTASDYNQVLDSAHNAQQVFVENAPMIVMYGNWRAYAHRIDKYEGWVEIPGWGLGHMNRWTPRKVRLKEGQLERDPVSGCGGTFRTSISSAMDSQNPLTSKSVYGNYPLSQVYSRLTGLNDDKHMATKNNGGLAYDWTVQPHPYGLKYTYSLFDNACWHDLGGAAGGLVTADDVEFSYNYILDHRIPTFSANIPYLNSCTAIDATHVEIVTNGRSYWAFDMTRGWTILPEHIWAGIVSPVTFTNPLPVGSGPFSWYRRIEGEYVELHHWENYHKGIPGHTEAVGSEPISYLPIYIIVGVVVIIVVLLGSVWYLRRK